MNPEISFGSGTMIQGFSLFLASEGLLLLAGARATIWRGKSQFHFARAGDPREVEMDLRDFLETYPERSDARIFRSWVVQDRRTKEWIGELRDEASDFVAVDADTAETFERFCLRCLSAVRENNQPAGRGHEKRAFGRPPI